MMTVQAVNGIALAQKQWKNKLDDKQSLEILIVNLMPTKETTELQFLKLLERTQINCRVTFAYPDSHHFHHGNSKIIKKYYLPLSKVLQQNFDGLIVTGAPVEHLDFTEVDYWDDFQKLVEWSKQTKIHTIFECWASQAALKVKFDIDKLPLVSKLFGVYQAEKIDTNSSFLLGFGSGGPIRMPQSRHTKLILPAKLPDELQVLAKSQEVEAFLLATTDQKNLFITGHPEYDTRTLDREYKRDLEKGKPISKPNNYYQNNQIVNQWFQSSVKLYTNWLNLIHTT
ncbi:homoserine O-succinyltransferase [Ligilactobacillus salivarius]|uniref:homoserine O-acetyltransferase/O-succinyltransferase family protein n=1 Tax=Ligilactobacillus salivarius TaxID=1624 RepID=UPI00339C7A0B